MSQILTKSQLSLLLSFSVFCSFIVVSCFSYSPAKCRSEEKAALLQFKSHFSCNGSPDDCSSSFTFSWKEDGGDCCYWHGVYCNIDTGYVVHLELGSDYLDGFIPSNSSLFHLIHLAYIDLSRCNFENSQILPLFGNFPNLASLSLADCGLSGVVPHEIFQLPNLIELDLSGNGRLTGKLPDSIGNLASLEKLSLGGCNFSGSIPTSIGNLTWLNTLNITSNNFSGEVPASLSKLVYLQYLDLSYNNFEGPILHSILNLTQSTTIDLSANHFTDVIELGVLPKFQTLEYLDLSNSGLSLTTNSSDFLSSFPLLNTLRLSSCRLSSNLLKNLSANRNMLYIDLSNNTIMNKLDPSICKLNSIYYLDLSHNQFYGPIPTCLGNSSETLSMLNLQGNKLHGMIPQSFGNAKNIHVLDLSNNFLHGKIPRSLVNCTELEVLTLGSNELKDGFPFWLGDLSFLKVLDLRKNNLFGTITENSRTKGHFTRMHIIDMSNNYLSGTLPSSLFDSWNAMMNGDEKNASTYAYVQSKREKGDGGCGRVPLTDCSTTGPYHYYYSLNIMNKGVYLPYKRVLTALKVVDFSDNRFYGIIPPSVGRLKGMHVLNLSGNALTGPVPSFLVNLSNLESLDLSNNMLSGEIPRDMSSLNSLGVLDLSQNNLTGGIPSYLDKFPNASYEGNRGLCGLPLSRLCTNADKPNLNSPPQKLPSKMKHHIRFNLDGFGWEVVVVGYGCGMLIGLVIGYFIPVRNSLWFAQIFGFDLRQYGPRARNARFRIR